MEKRLGVDDVLIIVLILSIVVLMSSNSVVVQLDNLAVKTGLSPAGLKAKSFENERCFSALENFDGNNIARVQKLCGGLTSVEANNYAESERVFSGTCEEPRTDINGDSIVDFGDVLQVLRNWMCTSCTREDVNEDGVVDFADIVEILGNWGCEFGGGVEECTDEPGCPIVLTLSMDENIRELGQPILLKSGEGLPLPIILHDIKDQGIEITPNIDKIINEGKEEQLVGKYLKEIEGIHENVIVHHYILLENEIRYELYDVYNVLDIAPGSVISAQAIVLDNEAIIKNLVVLVQETAGNDAIGEQKTLVLFGRGVAGDPYGITREEIDELIFNGDLVPSVNGYLRDVSYNLAWLSGITLGDPYPSPEEEGVIFKVNGGELIQERTTHSLYDELLTTHTFSDGSTIEITSVDTSGGPDYRFWLATFIFTDSLGNSVSDTFDWQGEGIYDIEGVLYDIELYAFTSGYRARIFYPLMKQADPFVDYNDYDRLIFVSDSLGLGSAGLAALSRSTFYTDDGEVDLYWAANSVVSHQEGLVSVTIHELGHSFGFGHANTWECGEDIIYSDSCASDEYGNALDSLGSSNFGHFNAHMKNKNEWFEDTRVLETDAEGVYVLNAYSSHENNLKSLRIPLVNDPERHYFLEFRREIGYDENPMRGGVPLNPEVYDGPLVIYDLMSSGSSQLLDMTPHVGSGTSEHREDSAFSNLLITETYEDPFNRIALTSLSFSEEKSFIYLSDAERAQAINFGGFVVPGELTYSIERFDGSEYVPYETPLSGQSITVLPGESEHIYSEWNDLLWQPSQVGEYKLIVTLFSKPDSWTDEIDFSVHECGNGIQEPGEECDGTDLGGQTCVDLGFVNGGDLSCALDCSFDTSQCLRNNRVFITSLTYNGNLGGIVGADEICQTHADAPGVELGGDWKAWISNDTTGPIDRFVQSNEVYALIDGTIIADDWEDLTNGNIQNPIDVTEKGFPPVGYAIWTSTLPDGSTLGRDNCLGWTHSDYTSNRGIRGSRYLTDNRWTYLTSGIQCPTNYHLYCFEQI